MRIGVMLRHMGQHGGGVSVYTRNLLRELLALDSPHQFVLIYGDPRFLGRYADAHRVREIAVRTRFRPVWDQVTVPWVARREKLDLLFNPKYAVPLRTATPVVFVCHGLNWLIEPHWKGRLDGWNQRYLFPLFFQKAARIIAVSETTRAQIIAHYNVEETRVQTVHHAASDLFGRPAPERWLATVRADFALPERFFLYCGQIYPPKNFGRLLEAYARVGPQRGIHLVVAGEQTTPSGEDLRRIDALDLSQWVVWSGWVAQSTLPAFYALAEALVLPSLYDSFGLPILEAMASGCPVVTSDRYGTKEVAGEAALLVDPESVDSIVRALCSVADDPSIRRRLTAAGRQRARQFSWKKCAMETLRVLESAVPEKV